MSSETTPEPTHSAFVGTRLLARGALREVLVALKAHGQRKAHELALVFEDDTGRQVDFDLREDVDTILADRTPPRGPGRPKLGVVAREVTLLPRHWEWLELQPNGASAALRRLVEQARKSEPPSERAKRMRAALSRVMSALAGNLPNFEEALRALYAPDQARLESLIKKWPKDVRAYVIDQSRAATSLEVKKSK